MTINLSCSPVEDLKLSGIRNATTKIKASCSGTSIGVFFGIFFKIRDKKIFGLVVPPLSHLF